MREIEIVEREVSSFRGRQLFAFQPLKKECGLACSAGTLYADEPVIPPDVIMQKAFKPTGGFIYYSFRLFQQRKHFAQLFMKIYRFLHNIICKNKLNCTLRCAFCSFRAWRGLAVSGFSGGGK